MRHVPGLAVERGVGTSRISTSQPTACAYFLRVVTGGECLPAASKRETALLVVPRLCGLFPGRSTGR